MHRQTFPFEEYKDWGPVPEAAPKLNVEHLSLLDQWHSSVYKRPIHDSIAADYKFFPSDNGALSYVHGAARKNRPEERDGESREDNLARVARRTIHIAESTEYSTAFFLALANTRLTSLKDATSGHQTTGVDKFSLVNSADAIADYGFCLVNPADIIIKEGKKVDMGPGLKAKIEGIAPGVGQALLDFGNYAAENTVALDTIDGELALQLALSEQERRVALWGGRHSAIRRVFPQVKPSLEIIDLSSVLPNIPTLSYSN